MGSSDKKIIQNQKIKNSTNFSVRLDELSQKSKNFPQESRTLVAYGKEILHPSKRQANILSTVFS